MKDPQNKYSCMLNHIVGIRSSEDAGVYQQRAYDYSLIES